MSDPNLNKLETEGVALGGKALGWLKRNWYAFLIGGACGVLLGHLFWH